MSDFAPAVLGPLPNTAAAALDARVQALLPASAEVGHNYREAAAFVYAPPGRGLFAALAAWHATLEGAGLRVMLSMATAKTGARPCLRVEETHE